MKTSIDWNAFNALKHEAFNTKTPEEWETIKAKYQEMMGEYCEQTKAVFREKTAPQLQALHEKKKTYWDKQGNRPTVVRNNYILRENEGLAFTRLCNALADYLEARNAVKTTKQQYSPAPETNVPSLAHPLTDR